jgi:hypothetical protein
VVSSFQQGKMKLLFVWFGGLVRQGRYEIDSGFINSTGELNYHSDGFVTFSYTIVQSKTNWQLFESCFVSTPEVGLGQANIF